MGRVELGGGNLKGGQIWSDREGFGAGGTGGRNERSDKKGALTARGRLDTYNNLGEYDLAKPQSIRGNIVSPGRRQSQQSLYFQKRLNSLHFKTQVDLQVKKERSDPKATNTQQNGGLSFLRTKLAYTLSESTRSKLKSCQFLESVADLSKLDQKVEGGHRANYSSKRTSTPLGQIPTINKSLREGKNPVVNAGGSGRRGTNYQGLFGREKSKNYGLDAATRNSICGSKELITSRRRTLQSEPTVFEGRVSTPMVQQSKFTKNLNQEIPKRKGIYDRVAEGKEATGVAGGQKGGNTEGQSEREGKGKTQAAVFSYNTKRRGVQIEGPVDLQPKVHSKSPTVSRKGGQTGGMQGGSTRR
jgi:hypothetical protein